MINLCSIFDRHAPDDFAGTAADQTGADTQAGDAANGAEAHDFGLEFRENPFTSFMRKLRDMIERDPREAMRMVENARSAKIFTKSYEQEGIQKAKDRIIEALSHEKPEGSLAHQFLRSVLDASAPAPASPAQVQLRNQIHLAPALRPSFLAPGNSGLAALSLNL
jgi:hypothetical protein